MGNGREKKGVVGEGDNRIWRVQEMSNPRYINKNRMVFLTSQRERGYDFGTGGGRWFSWILYPTPLLSLAFVLTKE